MHDIISLYAAIIFLSLKPNISGDISLSSNKKILFLLLVNISTKKSFFVI